MALYNILYGRPTENKTKFVDLLFNWNISVDDFPRFRNVEIEVDRPIVSVYTRIGGGNREYYQEEIEKLEKLEGYSYDEDDDYDCTYATFYYNIPERNHHYWRQYIDDINTRDNDK